MASQVGILGVRVPLNASAVVQNSVNHAYSERSGASQLLGDVETYRIACGASAGTDELMPYDNALFFELVMQSARIIWNECAAKNLIPFGLYNAFAQFEERVRSVFLIQQTQDDISRNQVGDAYAFELSAGFNILHTAVSLLEFMSDEQYGVFPADRLFRPGDVLTYIASDDLPDTIGIVTVNDTSERQYDPTAALDEKKRVLRSRLKSMTVANSVRYLPGSVHPQLVVNHDEVSQQIEIFRTNLGMFESLDKIPFTAHIEDSTSNGTDHQVDHQSHSDASVCCKQLVQDRCQERLDEINRTAPKDRPTRYENDSTFLAYVMPMLINTLDNSKQRNTTNNPIQWDGNGDRMVPKHLGDLHFAASDQTTLRRAEDLALYRDSYMRLAIQTQLAAYAVANLISDATAYRWDYYGNELEIRASQVMINASAAHWLFVAQDCYRDVVQSTQWPGWSAAQPFEHWEHDLLLAWFVQSRVDRAVLEKVGIVRDILDLHWFQQSVFYALDSANWSLNSVTFMEQYMRSRFEVLVGVEDGAFDAAVVFYTNTQLDAMSYWVRRVDRRAEKPEPYSLTIHSAMDSLSVSNVAGNMIMSRHVKKEARLLSNGSNRRRLARVFLEHRQGRVDANGVPIWEQVLVQLLATGSFTALSSLRNEAQLLVGAQGTLPLDLSLLRALDTYAATRPWYHDPWSSTSSESKRNAMDRFLAGASSAELSVYFARIAAFAASWYSTAFCQLCRLGASLQHCSLALEDMNENAIEETFASQAVMVDLDLTRRNTCVELQRAYERLSNIQDTPMVHVEDRPRRVVIRLPPLFLSQFMPPRAKRSVSVNEVRINGHRLVLDSSIMQRVVLLSDVQKSLAADQTFAVVEIRPSRCECWSNEHADCHSYRRRREMLEHMKRDSTVPASERDLPSFSPVLQDVIQLPQNAATYDRMLSDAQRCEQAVVFEPKCNSFKTTGLTKRQPITPTMVLNDYTFDLQIDLLIYEVWQVDNTEVRVADAFQPKHTCSVQVRSEPGTHIRVCPINYKGGR